MEHQAKKVGVVLGIRHRHFCPSRLKSSLSRVNLIHGIPCYHVIDYQLCLSNDSTLYPDSWVICSVFHRDCSQHHVFGTENLREKNNSCPTLPETPPKRAGTNSFSGPGSVQSIRSTCLTDEVGQEGKEQGIYGVTSWMTTVVETQLRIYCINITG